MTTTTELPTVKEELDRKTVESIEWLLHAHTVGNLTENQFAAAIDALFMAVNGVVSEDVAQMLTEASQLPSRRTEVLKRHFIKDGALVTVQRDVGGTAVQYATRVNGKIKTQRKTEYDSAREAAEGMATSSRIIVGSGYEEI